MGVTSPDQESDQRVAPRLNFDRIKELTAAKLGIPVPEVTDQVLGDLIGMTRDSIGRLRRGTYTAALETAVAFSNALNTTVDALLNQQTGESR